MKYRIKKDKRQEALDLLLARKVVQKKSRVKTLVYEQKPMQIGQWTRYFNVDEMDYFLEQDVKETPICCICGQPCENEWGNNPYPVKEEGRCCDMCNLTKVIPARIEQLNEKENKEIENPVEKPTQEEIEDYYGI